MPYLGRQVVTNLADFHVDNYAAGGGFTAGSTTQLTLTVAGIDDEEALSIFFDGVHQHHNTYTIASSVVTFDAAIPTGTANVEIHYGKQPVASALAANSIDSEHYVNASIDGEHLKTAIAADFSDVTITAADLIMYGDATDSNNTKRDTVQGILDLAGGGAWRFISSTTVSAAASVAFTSLTAYPIYKFIIRKLTPVASSPELYCTVSIDNGSTYLSSTYDSAGKRKRCTDGSDNGVNDNGTAQWRITSGGGLNNASGANTLFEMTLDRNSGAVSGGFCNITFSGAIESSGNDFEYLAGSGNVEVSGNDVDAVKLAFSSGNISTAVCLLYGIAEA